MRVMLAHEMHASLVIRSSSYNTSCRPHGKAGLDSGLDWTGLDRTGLFLGGVTFLTGGVAVLFFLVCKIIAFSTFRQQAIFFHLGGGRRKGGSII